MLRICGLATGVDFGWRNAEEEGIGARVTKSSASQPAVFIAGESLVAWKRQVVAG